MTMWILRSCVLIKINRKAENDRNGIDTFIPSCSCKAVIFPACLLLINELA